MRMMMKMKMMMGRNERVRFGEVVAGESVFHEWFWCLEMEHGIGPISNAMIGSGRKICFAAELDSELPRQLHRAPTPYPKELRNLAKHARNVHNQATNDPRVCISQFCSIYWRQK